ncbi:uncharacterized protein ACNLHF_013256 [Anomaloglossus baeobatrachus]
MDNLLSTIKSNSSEDFLQRFNEEMDLESHKCEKEVVEYKSKKFQRDLTDQANNRVYKWKTGAARARSQSRAGFGTRSRSTSLRSASSMDDTRSATSESSYNKDESRGITTRSGPKKPGPSKPGPGKSQDGKSKNKLQVINLSNYVLSETQVEVLSLGLSFSPTNSFHYFTALKDLYLFSRKLVLKKLHNKRDVGLDTLTDTEREALAALEELLLEQTIDAVFLLYVASCSSATLTEMDWI